MKSAEEWAQDQLRVNADMYPEDMQDFIRAIQADALESAALHEESRCEDPILGAEIGAGIRSLKPKETG